MKINQLSTRGVQWLFCIIAYAVSIGSFRYSIINPLAQFVFDNARGIDFCDRWVIPLFGLICILIGWAIPYGVMPSLFLNKKNWLYIGCISILGLFVFCVLSLFSAIICRRIHATMFPVREWVADSIFLMIPVGTMTVILAVGMYKRFRGRRHEKNQEVSNESAMNDDNK